MSFYNVEYLLFILLEGGGAHQPSFCQGTQQASIDGYYHSFSPPSRRFQQQNLSSARWARPSIAASFTLQQQQGFGRRGAALFGNTHNHHDCCKVRPNEAQSRACVAGWTRNTFPVKRSVNNSRHNLKSDRMMKTYIYPTCQSQAAFSSVCCRKKYCSGSLSSFAFYNSLFQTSGKNYNEKSKICTLSVKFKSEYLSFKDIFLKMSQKSLSSALSPNLTAFTEGGGGFIYKWPILIFFS